MRFVSAQPETFMTFLREHWKDAYSAFFAFQIQPLDPDLHCCLVHLLPRENGKGDQGIVDRLQSLADRLERYFHFRVVGFAFDGDRCFNGLHGAYASEWTALMPMTAWDLLTGPNCSGLADQLFAPSNSKVVAGDPLHIEKRVRYRMVSRDEFYLAWCDRASPQRPPRVIKFSLRRIREAHVCPELVFVNSKASKMHDSLPLELFSSKTLDAIMTAQDSTELLMVPWCLLNVALTHPGINTKTRGGYLEVGFWILVHTRGMKEACDARCGIVEAITGTSASLYLGEQLDHALNTFHALIRRLRSSTTRICLNRVGSNPLEHSFGKGRVRCKEINTMKKMEEAFVSEAFAQFAKGFLELLSAPRRRLSVGVDCEPWSASGPSILTISPWNIARAIVQIIMYGTWFVQVTPLLAIPAMTGPHGELLPAKPSSPISRERKAKNKKLSSNQMFFDLYHTPQLDRK
jgi:hypothetical protein